MKRLALLAAVIDCAAYAWLALAWADNARLLILTPLMLLAALPLTMLALAAVATIGHTMWTWIDTDEAG